MAAELYSQAVEAGTALASHGLATVRSYQPLAEQTMFAPHVPYVTDAFEVRSGMGGVNSCACALRKYTTTPVDFCSKQPLD